MNRLIAQALAVIVTVVMLPACDTQTVANDKTEKNTADKVVRVTTSGALKGVDKGNYLMWLGIPYAQPPEGDLRWQAPIAYTSKDLVTADKFGSMCSQAVVDNLGIKPKQYTGKEDCLFLNIWSPPLEKSAEKLPVMVWIHGGGNVVGSGNIDASQLAYQQDVVVVSINYRLGTFGWLSHPALQKAATSNEARSGNFGTLDIILALQWVQDNIDQFGGDSSRVTIFGESAGGINVFSLLHSPKAKGLFHRAIAQSSFPWMTSVPSAENYVDSATPGHLQSSAELVLQLLMNDGQAVDRQSAKKIAMGLEQKKIEEYLRSKTYAQFEVALDQLYLSDPFKKGLPEYNSQSPKLFQDGEVLAVTDLEKSVVDSQFNSVPIILGTTHYETKGLLNADPKFVQVIDGKRIIKNKEWYLLVSDYTTRLWRVAGVDEPAKILAKQLPDVFAYRFDWDALPISMEGENINDLYAGAHGSDYGFIFGYEQSIVSTPLTQADKSLSNAMMSYWAEFAYNGKPGKGRNGELPEWRAWSNSNNSDKTLLLDIPIDGGIRMSAESETHQEVMSKVPADPIAHETALVCRLYRDIWRHSFHVSRAELGLLENSYCERES